jgi:hypothetical protein
MERLKTGNITSKFCVLAIEEVNEKNKRLLTAVKP